MLSAAETAMADAAGRNVARTEGFVAAVATVTRAKIPTAIRRRHMGILADHYAEPSFNRVSANTQKERRRLGTYFRAI